MRFFLIQELLAVTRVPCIIWKLLKLLANNFFDFVFDMLYLVFVDLFLFFDDQYFFQLEKIVLLGMSSSEKTPHGFITQCCAMHAISVCTETINLFLTSCGVDDLHLVFGYDSLKTGLDQNLQISRCVLLAFQIFHIFVNFVSGVEVSGHYATHKIQLKLAGINPNNWFANVREIARKRLINDSFHVKTTEGQPSISSPASFHTSLWTNGFLHQSFSIRMLRRLDKVHSGFNMWKLLWWSNATIRNWGNFFVVLAPKTSLSLFTIRLFHTYFS